MATILGHAPNMKRELLQSGPKSGGLGREHCRWRGAISGGRERSLVEGSSLRWRGDHRWKVSISGGGERLLLEGSGLRWRGAVSGGEEQSKEEGSDLRWKGAG